MTRGRPPLAARRVAQEIASRCGVVLDAAGLQATSYDFILFCSSCSVFIRVKRIRMHISNPPDIARMFREEILLLRRLPKTAVVSRELWVVSPWGLWQYFLISDDSVVEIRCNGLPPRPVQPVNPVPGTVPVSLQGQQPGKMPAPLVPEAALPAGTVIQVS